MLAPNTAGRLPVKPFMCMCLSWLVALPLLNCVDRFVIHSFWVYKESKSVACIVCMIDRECKRRLKLKQLVKIFHN